MFRSLYKASLSVAILSPMLLFGLFPGSAQAHVMDGPLAGFGSGFGHPLAGFDHLMAMLAVGIWGAQMGGRSVWTLPTTFPLIMCIGGLMGMVGLLPAQPLEYGISLSVIVLGAAIAAAWKAREWAALLLISAFALMHGYPHGVLAPRANDPTAFIVGFVVATGLIHVVGIGIGAILKPLWKGRLVQLLGLAIALSGLWFLYRLAIG
ncbi:HupE/UreJ family protein [Peteryoungia desertarenae]|uniref:HupE/UreJ family protein n=1 Tax=Peteryoungia desertarenae TaxID=1813451 RepID=A0ABX6QLI1_9HYPH|nr:HupE/UreJ family protein [Peteryoungia desertarenae]QLF69426.1 HupE/UreJ family protein [Peteryoungia desertarenae]